MDLKKTLHESLKGAKRLAVLCVGSELRSDDAAGLLCARELKKKLARKKNNRIKVFIGETAPENLTGDIRAFKPDFVMIIDAADTGKPVGTVLILEPESLKGHSFCTHQMPMAILTDYLTHTMKCRVLVMGIQPKTLTFGKPPSQKVRRTAAQVATSILDAFKV